MPVCYIPRVETKERECWKFLDWRLNSETTCVNILCPVMCDPPNGIDTVLQHGSNHRSASLYFSLIDLWLTKDNRLLNPKSSYERILMAPTCRLIARFHFLILIFIFFLSPSFNNYYLIVASKLMDDLSLVFMKIK